MPPFGLALAFLWPMIISEGGLLGLDTVRLGGVMQLEFIVVVGGGFLIMPLMVPVPRRRWVLKAIQRVIFVGFAVLFASMAYGLLGWGVVLGYGALIHATFGGLWIARSDLDENALQIAETLLRWLSLFVLFPAALALGGAPSSVNGWGREGGVPVAGVLYFTLLGAIELGGVFGLLRRVNWREWGHS